MSFRGYTLYVEIKSTRGYLSASQRAFKDHVENMTSNNKWFLVRDVEELKKIVKNLEG